MLLVLYIGRFTKIMLIEQLTEEINFIVSARHNKKVHIVCVVLFVEVFSSQILIVKSRWWWWWWRRRRGSGVDHHMSKLNFCLQASKSPAKPTNIVWVQQFYKEKFSLYNLMLLFFIIAKITSFFSTLFTWL
jgi:hypothetical protein